MFSGLSIIEGLVRMDKAERSCLDTHSTRRKVQYRFSVNRGKNRTPILRQDDPWNKNEFEIETHNGQFSAPQSVEKMTCPK